MPAPWVTYRRGPRTAPGTRQHLILPSVVIAVVGNIRGGGENCHLPNMVPFWKPWPSLRRHGWYPGQRAGGGDTAHWARRGVWKHSGRSPGVTLNRTKSLGPEEKTPDFC